MSNRLSWTREDDRLVLRGELDQDFLNPLWEARNAAMRGVTCIDLHAVTRVDTAGLALLVHLVALAKQQGKAVTLDGMSENLHTLAQLYHLPDSLLGLRT